MSPPALSPEQRRALAAVLDLIVPPSADGRMPGAGELGIGDLLEENQRERPELRPGLEEGLALLDELAAGASGAAKAAPRFVDLEAPERRRVLDAVVERLPAFLGPLVFQGYLGYYRHPRVLEALGLEARPPHPRGYEVPPTDFSILDPVRRRAPFYRKP